MPAKTTAKRGAAKRRPPKKAPEPAPDRFTEDGKRIVKLEKTRAHQRYILKNGTQVPGASTICKIGDDNSSLIHLAIGHRRHRLPEGKRPSSGHWDDLPFYDRMFSAWSRC
jgi:hypothetical protein